jgi:ParB/RepB/Spo0J family partition protein
MEMEFHQIDLRFEGLRSRGRDTERRLLGALDEAGQQVPIVVVEEFGRFVVIDGYKRVRALRRLSRDTVSVVVWPLSVPEALIVERASRRGEGPSAFEHGWLLVELREHHGFSGEDLARRLGRSASWVSRHLGLVREVPDAVQEYVRAGRLPAQAVMKHLLPVCRVRREAACALAEVAVREQLSSRDLGDLGRGWLRSSELVRARLLADPALFLRSRRELAVTVPPRPSGDGPRRDLEVALALIRRAGRSVSVPVPLRPDIDALRGLAADAVAALGRLVKRLEEGERSHAEAQPTDDDPGVARARDAAAEDRADPRPVAESGAPRDPVRADRGSVHRPHESRGRTSDAGPGPLCELPGQPGPSP